MLRANIQVGPYRLESEKDVQLANVFLGARCILNFDKNPMTIQVGTDGKKSPDFQRGLGLLQLIVMRIHSQDYEQI